MKHENRIPAPGQEGRMRITPEEGMAPFYAKLEMADNPSTDGTAWEKPVMDEFLAALGTTAGTATALTLAQPGFVLTDGALVRFKTHTAISRRSASAFTLNIEGTGAKAIRYANVLYPIMDIPAGTWITAIYSETLSAYILQLYDGLMPVAYGTCTNTGTALTATLTNAPGWQQTDGALIAITFSSAVAANANLNVVSKGAGTLRVGGANITAGVIPAGATATLMRSGTYWLVLAVDKTAASGRPSGMVVFEVSGVFIPTLFGLVAGDVLDVTVVGGGAGGGLGGGSSGGAAGQKSHGGNTSYNNGSGGGAGGGYGAGGAGGTGGAPSYGGPIYGAGGGGGSGRVTQAKVVLTSTANIPVTIGTPGAAGASGGSSSFGSYATATGGSPGGAYSGLNGGAGGAGGQSGGAGGSSAGSWGGGGGGGGGGFSLLAPATPGGAGGASGGNTTKGGNGGASTGTGGGGGGGAGVVSSTLTWGTGGSSVLGGAGGTGTVGSDPIVGSGSGVVIVRW